MSGSRTLKLSILADVDNLKKNLDTGAKEVEGFGGKMEKFGKVAAAAFAAAAVAAAAYAGKLAIEGVKAAIEDEAAQLRLANALKNVTNATDTQIAAIETQIGKMSLAYGIADDELRPAFQRLATATGSLETANNSLNLALDISAATGKSVESVSNALAKAYEGNTGALAKLGVGLSAAEIKSMGLDNAMIQLGKTFGGAALTQANTMEGQINRLKILFEETKESVGAGLLPAVQGFLDYTTNKFIPLMIEAKDKALDPIKKAFEENEDALRALWNFGVKYLVPFFENTLVAKIQLVGKAIAATLTIIGKVVSGMEGLINKGIDGINGLIKAWNSIPDWAKPGGDIAYVPKVNFTKNTDTSGQINTSTGSIYIPTPFKASDTGSSTGVSGSGNTSGGGTGGSGGNSGTIKIPTPTLLEKVAQENWLKNMAAGAFDPSAFRRADERTVNITVNGAVDAASTARQIAEILNSEASSSGSFSGLGVSRFATRVD